MIAKDHADIVISMDADLQDDINAIDVYYHGFDIVYGVRSKRQKDILFKRLTVEGFYKIMALMGTEVIFNHADYRLMSKRSLIDLFKFKEVSLFLRGIIPLAGYFSRFLVVGIFNTIVGVSTMIIVYNYRH